MPTVYATICRQEPCWQTSINGRHLRRGAICTQIACSIQNGPFHQSWRSEPEQAHGPFSSLPAEELPHFRVELPSYNQPHPPWVLPEQVSMIPCVITALFKPFLHKGAELSKQSVYEKNHWVQQASKCLTITLRQRCRVQIILCLPC